MTLSCMQSSHLADVDVCAPSQPIAPVQRERTNHPSLPGVSVGVAPRERSPPPPPTAHPPLRPPRKCTARGRTPGYAPPRRPGCWSPPPRHGAHAGVGAADAHRAVAHQSAPPTTPRRRPPTVRARRAGTCRTRRRTSGRPCAATRQSPAAAPPPAGARGRTQSDGTRPGSCRPRPMTSGWLCSAVVIPDE